MDCIQEAREQYDRALRAQNSPSVALIIAHAQAAALIAIAEIQSQPELLLDASLLWAARKAAKWLSDLREAGHVDILIECQPDGVGMLAIQQAIAKYD